MGLSRVNYDRVVGPHRILMNEIEDCWVMPVMCLPPSCIDPVKKTLNKYLCGPAICDSQALCATE